eukprot:TRINITY_DN15637_c0_g1_i1.p1 TRINITY_DN15637_c0_g1~~TRINITY_DN15637_c0_g1_i1.p1  ORF type:complete len:279 (+),score=55.30 TRINITY_DN15637_c0_g1_i1:38-874(+)
MEDLLERVQMLQKVQDVLGREQRKEKEQMKALCSELVLLREQNRGLQGTVVELRKEVRAERAERQRLAEEVGKLKAEGAEERRMAYDGIRAGLAKEIAELKDCAGMAKKISSPPTVCNDCIDGWDACKRYAPEIDTTEWKDTMQSTPLHAAVHTGNQELLEHLFACHNGAQWANIPEAPLDDSDNYTPLHRAAIRSRVRMIPLLVSNGAQVNTPCSRGGTPLWHASRKRYLACVKALLDVGADPSIPDGEGRLPIDLVPQGCHRTRTLLTLHAAVCSP